MSFVVLNSIGGHALADSLNHSPVLKTGIGLVSTEPAEETLVGMNLLDNNHFSIPKGFHFSIGAEGEVWY